MPEWFQNLSPLGQAFLATCFTYTLTALGAAGVYFFKEVNEKIVSLMLGFAAGVMIAASYWSLLEPSIELSKELRLSPGLPAAIGFLLGGIFLKLMDMLIPHLHLGFSDESKEGLKTSWRRAILLVMAVTIHNIPEGLAVGVAFGALSAKISSASLSGALILALGIGIQNIPEGMAISIPLRSEGLSRNRSFFYGQISGLVEIVSGVVGAVLAIGMRKVLPYILAFAAGAMIYVVIEELIPEAERGDNSDLATIGVFIGFVVMMVLDVTLG